MHCESQKTSLSIIENKFKFQTKLNLLSNIARKPIIVFFSFLYTRPPPSHPPQKGKIVWFLCVCVCVCVCGCVWVGGGGVYFSFRAYNVLVWIALIASAFKEVAFSLFSFFFFLVFTRFWRNAATVQWTVHKQ